MSQILVQSPGTVVDPGFPESKFRPVVLVRKSSFLHIVQLSLTVTVKSVWISLHKHQLSGTEEKKNPLPFSVEVFHKSRVLCLS